MTLPASVSISDEGDARRLLADAVRDLARTIAEVESQRQAARRPWWRRGGGR